MNRLVFSVILCGAAVLGAEASAALTTAFVTRFGDEEAVVPLSPAAPASEAAPFINGDVESFGDQVQNGFIRPARSFRDNGRVTRFMSEAQLEAFGETEAEGAAGIIDLQPENAVAISERFVGQRFEGEFTEDEAETPFELTAFVAPVAEEAVVLENPLPGAFVAMLAGLAGLGGLAVRKRKTSVA